MVITLQDIADRTKTSKSTVSRYLNGGSVSAEKAARIQEAILQLNYQPNMNARRLVSSRAASIAVVFDDISDYIYSEMMAGILEVAGSRELSCLFLSRATGQDESSYLSLISSGMADGLIFVSFRRRSLADIQKLQASNRPFVLVGDHQEAQDICAVDVDNRAGTQGLVKHLVDQGHRQIAYLQGPDHMPAASRRLAGYRDALMLSGIPVNGGLIRQIAWSAEAGYQATSQLLDSMQFSALVASNAYAAYGAMMAIKDRGFSVPRNVAVAGFDEAPILELARPAITTLRQPLRTLGQTAAEKLIRKLDKAPPPGQLQLLMPQMILRASTGD